MQYDFRRLINNLFPVLLLSGLSMSSFAFDNDRKGFSVGIGAGSQSTVVDFISSEKAVFTGNYTGAAASMRIGLGFSNRFLYYLAVDMASYDAPDDIGGELVSYTSSLQGVVAAYYLKERAPSAYALGGVGWGNLTIDSPSFSDSDDGSALILGGGYEFMRHHSIELTILSTSIASKYSDIDSIDSVSTRLMYQYAFY